MIEFFTQLVVLPMWAILTVGLFAIAGAIFIPIALIAWKLRKTTTQDGLVLMDKKQEKIDEKVQEVLLRLEQEKEEQRKLAKAREEYNETITEYEQERIRCAEERKALEEANKRRNGLLQALKSQRASIEQAKKETTVVVKKQDVQNKGEK